MCCAFQNSQNLKHKDGRFCVTKQDCSLNKSVFCIHRFANSRPVPSHPHCRPSSCQIWTGFFETGLEACSKKTNTFLLPHPLLPCLRTTRRKEFNNMHINNAYLTFWLCFSFLGLDYVLLSCYPTPFLGCVCAVSFTAEQRERKQGGNLGISIPKVTCDKASANHRTACFHDPPPSS